MKAPLSICLVTAFVANAYALSPSVALGVKVVDEEGGPLSGTSVVCIFPDKTRLGNDDYSIVTNRTGSDGMTRFHGHSYNGWVEYGMIEEDGYYPVDGIRVNFTNITGLVAKKWLPYEEMQTVTLQRKVNPTSLFVRKESKSWSRDLTTASGREFRYDLVTGDWMPPFGKGAYADVEFKLLPREDFGMGMGLGGISDPAFRDTVQVEFVGNDNGIAMVTPPTNAALKLRMAPEVGYRKVFNVWYGRTRTMQVDTSTDGNVCHAFRIRTIRSQEGKIVSALYGKVYGGFQLTYKVEDHPSGVAFTYYLNPTPNDRNLEWDMKHNLCPVRGSFNLP